LFGGLTYRVYKDGFYRIVNQTYKTAMFALHAMGEAQADFGGVTVKNKSGAEETWHELVLSFECKNCGECCRNVKGSVMLESFDLLDWRGI